MPQPAFASAYLDLRGVFRKSLDMLANSKVARLPQADGKLAW
jgi:hypothetical protein